MSHLIEQAEALAREAVSLRKQAEALSASEDGMSEEQEAEFDGLIAEADAKEGESKALSRFYLEIDWDGSEMLLQSRAHDETGYVQPTKAQLREVRGENSIYHNNCIQTWWVKESGEAENVEVS